MLRKVIKFKDFNGREREESFYFNLNKPEMMRLEMQFSGGIGAYVTRLEQDAKEEDIYNLFEKLIAMSYGVKDETGVYFKKSEEISTMFFQSAAYEALFEELLTDTQAAIAFFNGLMPADLVQSTAVAN